MSLPNKIKIVGITGNATTVNGVYVRNADLIPSYVQEGDTGNQFGFGIEDTWNLYDFANAAFVFQCPGTADSIPATPELTAEIDTVAGYGGQALIMQEPPRAKVAIKNETSPDMRGVYGVEDSGGRWAWVIQSIDPAVTWQIAWDADLARWLLELYFEEEDAKTFLGPTNYFSPLGDYEADIASGATGTATVTAVGGFALTADMMVAMGMIEDEED